MSLSTTLILSILHLFSCKAKSDAAEPKIESATHFSSQMIKDADGLYTFIGPKGGPTDIKITLTDITASGRVNIIGFYSDQNFLADTAVAQNGVVHYKNAKGLDQGLYYFSVPGRTNDYVQLFLGEDQEFEITATTSDINNTIQVTGSEDNSLFYESLKFESSLNPSFTRIANEMKTLQEGTDAYKALKAEREVLEAQRFEKVKEIYAKHPNSLFASYKYGGQNPKLREELSKESQVYHYRKEFWDNVNFNDARLLHTPMVGNKLKRYFKEVTGQHQDSILEAAHWLMEKIIDKPEYYKVISNWIVLTYEPGKSQLMDAEKVFVEMVRKYFTQEKAVWQDSLTTAAIQKRAFEMSGSLMNIQAPNVISTDNFGSKQEIYKMKADYIVVYMYNPDCEHCQEETPKLLKYWMEHRDSVDVFAIAIDTDDAEWKGYIAKNKLTWTNVHDPTNRSIYAKYYVDVTPEMYLLNKERKIIGKNLKSFQISTMIERDRNKKN